MKEWNEPGQILVLAYEIWIRNIQETCATANMHAHPFKHYPLYKYLAYVHILTSVQRQELDFWVSYVIVKPQKIVVPWKLMPRASVASEALIAMEQQSEGFNCFTPRPFHSIYFKGVFVLM